MTELQQLLFSHQDLPFRSFNQNLLPTLDPERVIGVRTPTLRALAKQLYGTAQAEAFLTQLPHTFFEENQLHAFLLEQRTDYDQLIGELNVFLPHVDNWATCDSLSPTVFRHHLSELKEQCRLWLDSEHTYEVRFAVCMLMKHYLGSHFFPQAMDWVANVRREEYYIQMAVAWYFATALSTNWADALPYLTEHRLDAWTHNKAIQKAIESRRITQEQKAYLRTLKVH